MRASSCTAAIASCLVVLATLVSPAEAGARERKVQTDPYPAILTPFGGGSYRDQRLGVFGGDVLLGAGIIFGDWSETHTFVMMPTLGWSGWRTLDKPVSLRANTFTGRLDLGYMNHAVWQGITVFSAGRIGTGRGPEPDRDPAQLYGAQVGVTYWPVTGHQPNTGLLGLEFQSNYSNFAGEWHHDLRFVLTVNLAPFVFGWLSAKYQIEGGYYWDSPRSPRSSNGASV